MYITSLVIPVPAENIDAYRKWAETSAAFFQGIWAAWKIVEAWEDFVPDGKQTDFPPRRRREAGRENRAATWQIWSDKETFEAAEHKMHDDPRMDSAGDPPFDPSRLILGCFQAAFDDGAELIGWPRIRNCGGRR